MARCYFFRIALQHTSSRLFRPAWAEQEGEGVMLLLVMRALSGHIRITSLAILMASCQYYGEEMESVVGQFDSVDAERSQVMQMGFWSPPNDTYDGMYDYMTKKIVRHARHPSSSPDVLGQRYTCFKKAVWGTLFNSRSFSPGWSDYPITYPHANGLWVRCMEVGDERDARQSRDVTRREEDDT